MFKEKESKVYFKRGLQSLKNKEISKTLSYFWKAVDMFPESIDAWNYLQYVYTRLGDLENAKKCMDRLDSILKRKDGERSLA